MRKTVKKILCSALVVVMVLTMAPLQGFIGMDWSWLDFSVKASAALSSSGSCGTNVSYTYNSSTGTVTIRGTGDMRDYSGSDTPFYKSNIKKVVIEKGVTGIGDNAFYECASLTGIAIPDSVTIIGDYAFAFCKKITSIYIPKNVSRIGTGAFYYAGLTELIFEEDSKLGVIEESAFVSCSFPVLVLPEGLSFIGYGTFALCDVVIAVFPSTLKYIGGDAFFECDMIDVCYRGTREQWEEAFDWYTNYRPDDLKYSTIHYDFSDDTKIATGKCGENLNWILMGNGTLEISGSGDMSYDRLPGWDSRSCFIKKVIFNGDITNIEQYAFLYCTNLEEITIPASVKTIGYAAFGDCAELTNVYYIGSEIQWSEINIGNNNENLTDADIHYDFCILDSENKHSIKTVVMVAPTCTEKGYTTYYCQCGYSYVDDYVEAKGHLHISQVTTPETHVAEGIETFTCACGDSYTKPIAKIAEHNYMIFDIVEPSCESEGYTVYYCECGVTYNGDKKAATGHSYNGDYCTDCGESKVDNCSCNCHKGGIAGFFWKIINFFNKLFKNNKTCACGVSHY